MLISLKLRYTSYEQILKHKISTAENPSKEKKEIWGFIEKTLIIMFFSSTRSNKQTSSCGTCVACHQVCLCKRMNTHKQENIRIKRYVFIRMKYSEVWFEKQK